MTLTTPLGFGEEVIRRCEDSLVWKRIGENKQYLSQLETVCNAAPKQETFAENFIVKIQNLDQRELAVQAKQVQHEEEPGFGVNITFFHCNCFLSGICSCFFKQVEHEEEPRFNVNITFFNCNCFLREALKNCFLGIFSK